MSKKVRANRNLFLVDQLGAHRFSVWGIGPNDAVRFEYQIINCIDVNMIFGYAELVGMTFVWGFFHMKTLPFVFFLFQWNMVLFVVQFDNGRLSLCDDNYGGNYKLIAN